MPAAFRFFRLHGKNCKNSQQQSNLHAYKNSHASCKNLYKVSGNLQKSCTTSMQARLGKTTIKQNVVGYISIFPVFPG